MSISKQKVTALLELINLYPSPHNGQPVRMRQISDDTFDLYFQKERGLQAADISYIFSFVSMGVFIEHASLAAQALGHRISYELHLPRESDLRGTGLMRFAVCRFHWEDAPPDHQLFQALRFRQTSRKKYYEGVSKELSDKIVQIAAAEHMGVGRLDKDQTRQTIWLNQRAVFDDMFDEPVRRELKHWLRYTRAQKQATRDGLSYDCMELGGRLMKFTVNHPGFLRLPGISWLTKRYYLRTMTDASDVFYMLAPFVTERDSFNVGLMIMKIWKTIAENGYYLHPFGSIMSNRAAHRDFLELAAVQHESRKNYLVFIFRCGKSQPPAPSLRLPLERHLLVGAADD